jgi:hypothetical protein
MRLYADTADKIAELLLTIRTTDSVSKREDAIDSICDIHREQGMTIEFANSVELIQYNDKDAFDVDRDRWIKERVTYLYNL